MRKFFIFFAMCLTVRADFVDTVTRCKLKDENCLKEQLQKLISEITTKGLPEYGVKAVDPMDLSGESMKVSDVLNVHFDTAELSGVKNIAVKNYKIDVEKGISMHEYEVSEIKLETNFTVKGSNELIQALLGSSSLNGNGHLVINIEKLMIEFSLPFKFVKRDGHVYFKILPHGHNFKFDIGNMHVTSDRIIIDGRDFREIATTLANENWKLFMNILDKAIYDLIIKKYEHVMENVYQLLPDDKLFEDDLEPLIKE